MPSQLPERTTALLKEQNDAIARRQAASTGLATETLRNKNRSGRWQRPYRGVYLAFSGDPGREAALSAALLRAGPGATLSHQTAAERHGLIDQPSSLIHITVPVTRRPARWANIPGVVVHRSTRIAETRHPAMLPPCTRVEDTVLDLIEAARTFEDAYAWLCHAVGRRKTTAERIVEAMRKRKKMRWRADIGASLGDVAGGILSFLERRYVYGVERPHGLPTARRQPRVRQRTGNKYLDNLYEAYGVCVELDGTAAHPADEQWRDKRRDNWNLVHLNVVTLRFGLPDLTDRVCETARDVATRLAQAGWPGPFRLCPRCPPHDHGSKLVIVTANDP
jgi:hypothetical protein